MIKSKIEAKDSFVVKFSAGWCQPCKMLSNMIDGITTSTLEIVNVDIDTEEGMDLASEYGVRNVPYMIAFHNGELVGRMIGSQARAEVASFLDPDTKHSER